MNEICIIIHNRWVHDQIVWTLLHFLCCNLLIFKDMKRQIQLHKKTYDIHIQFYTDKRHLFNQNTTFCSTTLKFQTPRTISIDNHFIYIYSFCVVDRKCIVVFSILVQYFRYFRPPSILGLNCYIWCYRSQWK
jgi:hypothetical protein